MSDRNKFLYLQVFAEVMSLYADIKDSQVIRVKRAELKQGEVAAEPLDFIVDVELKAGRTLGDDYFAHNLWFSVLNSPERYLSLPEHMRQALGKAFLENRLGIDGDYRALFYRMKAQGTYVVPTEETE